MHDVKNFFWDEPYIYRGCADGIIRRCVSEFDMFCVSEAYYSSLVGGHHTVSEQHIKSCDVATIGQPSTKMLMSLPRHVIRAKEIEVFLDYKSSL